MSAVMKYRVMIVTHIQARGRRNPPAVPRGHRAWKDGSGETVWGTVQGRRCRLKVSVLLPFPKSSIMVIFDECRGPKIYWPCVLSNCSRGQIKALRRHSASFTVIILSHLLLITLISPLSLSFPCRVRRRLAPSFTRDPVEGRLASGVSQ